MCTDEMCIMVNRALLSSNSYRAHACWAGPGWCMPLVWGNNRVCAKCMPVHNQAQTHKLAHTNTCMNTQAHAQIHNTHACRHALRHIHTQTHTHTTHQGEWMNTSLLISHTPLQTPLPACQMSFRRQYNLFLIITKENREMPLFQTRIQFKWFPINTLPNTKCSCFVCVILFCSVLQIPRAKYWSGTRNAFHIKHIHHRNAKWMSIYHINCSV